MLLGFIIYLLQKALTYQNDWTGLMYNNYKKYRSHSNKKNVFKRDFTTNSINEKWIGYIIYSYYQRWLGAI